MVAMTSLTPPTSLSLVDITSTRQPCFSANLLYMRKSSYANSAASSPPVPARISSTTFFWSFGSFGISRILISASSASRRSFRPSQLFLGELAHVGVAALDELFGLLDFLEHRLVLARLLDERLDFGERLRVLAVLVRVRLDRRGRQERRQLLVVRFDGIQLIQHDLNSTTRYRRQKRDLVAVRYAAVILRVVGVHRRRDRRLVARHLRETRPPARATRRRPSRLPARRATDRRSRRCRAAWRTAERSRACAAAYRASSRAASSSGLAVAPSIQTSPPSKNSCFQIGTICFTRSIT